MLPIFVLFVVPLFTSASAVVFTTFPYKSDHGHVAIYFASQTRTINRTICSIYGNVLYPITKEGFTLHIFVVLESNEIVDDGGLKPLYRAIDLHNSQNDVKNAELGPIFLHIHRWQNGSVPRPSHECVVSLRTHFQRATLIVFGRAYPRELLVHLHCRHICDEMRRNYERIHSITFQWILMARLDLLFIDKLFALRSLPKLKNRIYTPPWQHFGGINNRFAISSPSTMTVYTDLYERICDGQLPHFHRSGSSTSGFNTEQLYKWHLDRFHIASFPKQFPPFRFGRLRIGEELPTSRDLVPISYGMVCTNPRVVAFQLRAAFKKVECSPKGASLKLISNFNHSSKHLTDLGCEAAPRRRVGGYNYIKTH